jgi:prepilin-type N-terminal cleavage/methylation domain-containing protein
VAETRGFTLIETLIASVVLACGLVAVASSFSFVVRSNARNRQMTVATALLYDKMEEFKAAPLSDPLWMNGTGSEQITQGAVYVREWHVQTTLPRGVTLIVYLVEQHPPALLQTELLRATTLINPMF